jgi:anti-anti-sigma factor
MVSSVVSSDVAPRRRAAALSVWRDRDRTVVRLNGEHDIATVLVVADALAKATVLSDDDLIVDLSNVTFIGAATIHVLIRARDILSAQSRRLTVRSPSRCATRVLDLCGLTGIVEPSPPHADD